MQVEYRPCKQEHLALIRPQPHDQHLLAAYMHPQFKKVLEENFAISAWVGARPIGAAGIIHIHSHIALAWAMLGADAGPYLLPLTRKVRAALDISPFDRIEMRVKYGFEQGHQWARLLGFGEPEAPRMRKSGVNGEDETLYARIK